MSRRFNGRAGQRLVRLVPALRAKKTSPPDLLVEEHVIGEFLGVFLAADGRRIEPYLPTMTVSHIGSADLRDSARRSDTIVALVAGGEAKLSTIRALLDAQLCNTLITDEGTAWSLVRAAPRTGHI